MWLFMLQYEDNEKQSLFAQKNKKNQNKHTIKSENFSLTYIETYET